ncbi:Putative reductase 1 [Wickerhamiella sorbophila]|uniref:Reductase 1 n=1 Tax=Wickerhamiella sorbophila TaxID=45607 RepID=A0A2T0FP61_9ASCO|nr:Putative reductase 1 [Wickerhamiella sorbophila]PRT56767.1 Putative reductase 1 [Wickerhamiella sorbophila]
MSPRNLKLNSGYEIPIVGFGTYAATDDEGYKAVLEALKVGYRHIDTAFIYGNEKEVGQAIKDSGVPREQLFITTKVWPTDARNPAKSLERSLELLKLEYVDLLLMHWPYPLKQDPENSGSFSGSGIDEDWDFVKTWQLFQQLPKSQVRTIGVSNFTIKNLEKLLADPTMKTVPAVNQFELHPWYPCSELVKYCQDKGLVVEAYSPVARGKGTGNSIVESIAKKHNAQPGQIVLSWNVKRNVVVVPKSATPARIAANFEIVDLDDADMAKLEELGKSQERIVNTVRIYGRDIFQD